MTSTFRVICMLYREMLQHHAQPMLVLLWEIEAMFSEADIWFVSKNLYLREE